MLYTVKQRIEVLNGIESAVSRKIREAEKVLTENSLHFPAHHGRVAWNPVAKKIMIGGYRWEQAPFLQQVVASKRSLIPLIDKVVYAAERKLRVISEMKELSLG
jgi:hypothetical protein